MLDDSTLAVCDDMFRRLSLFDRRSGPHLFSPAEIALTSIASGRTFRAGGVNPAVLRASLLS